MKPISPRQLLYPERPDGYVPRLASADGATESDARLRVIYSNGTESNSAPVVAARLYKDEAGRRISEPTAGHSLATTLRKTTQGERDDLCAAQQVGPPMVAAHRELVHKIGVTSGSVERRIAGRKDQPTFLLADVEIVATYHCSTSAV